MKNNLLHTKKLENECLRLEQIRDVEGNPYWNIHNKTAEFLRCFVCATAPRHLLEIGTSNGYSALNFAKVLKDNKGHLHTIESHQERFSLAEKTIKDAEVNDCVTIYNLHAPEFFSVEPFVSMKFDFVFLDAVKYQYKEIVEGLVPLLSDCASIVIDNTDSHADELLEFREYLGNQIDFFVFELHIDDGLTILIRKQNK
jgi:predicted O-methyltransferase YrrM